MGAQEYIQHVRAVVRLVQKAALHDKAENLLVGQALVRLLGQCSDLPEDDPKGPMVRKETLRGSEGMERPHGPLLSGTSSAPGSEKLLSLQ